MRIQPLMKQHKYCNRINELTIQASNETYTSDQRNGMAKEIKELQSHLESLANTKVNNKYIFNGTNTNTKPVDIENIGKKITDLADIKSNNQLETLVLHYQGKAFTYMFRAVTLI